MRFLDARHRWNKSVGWILLFESFELFKKRCGLRSSVRIEEIDAMGKFLVCSVENHASKWRNVDAAGQDHRRPSDIVVQDEVPKGTLKPYFRPEGMVDKTRLKAVSRIRVTTTKEPSPGPLAMNKVLVFPSPSLSGGSSNVRSTACPALNVKPGGFSNSNATRAVGDFSASDQFRQRGNAFVAVMLELY
ncbi:MAG TPA: hypothetical protein VF749_05065 [Candidatus Acidoferrum sp.]